MKLIPLGFAASLLVLSAAAHAQSTTGTTTTPPTTTPPTLNSKSINERKTDQQDRIAQGLKSGELTAGEAKTLETQEAGINKEEHGMRAQDNGKLTTADKTLLNSQLNSESKEIYTDKHNDATQPSPKGELAKREDHQQDRIATGIKDNTLTTGQAAKLETQEAGITKEESGMKAQDNGKLTSADRKLLNRQLTQESRRIARDERKTLHHK